MNYLAKRTLHFAFLLLERFQKGLEESFRKEGFGSSLKKLDRVCKMLDLLIPAHDRLFFKEAMLYYQLGMMAQKVLCFQNALSKLEKIESKNVTSEIAYLFGNLHHWLGKRLWKIDEVEKALHYFEKAIDLYELTDKAILRTLHCDAAKAWSLLSDMSNEAADLKQAITHLKKAQNLEGPNGILLQMFGENYYKLAQKCDFEENFRLSFEYCSTALLDKNFDKKILKKIILTWVRAKKKLIVHTGKGFDTIDGLFFEALSLAPNEISLWLEWGEAYLREGWIKKDIALLEKGIEKLSSSLLISKDSPRFGLLLCVALMMVGFLLDDLKLLTDAKKRLDSVSPYLRQTKEEVYANALSEFLLSHYFRDASLLKKAIQSFKNGVQRFPQSGQLWWGLFESYCSYGIWQQEEKSLRSSLYCLSHLQKLFPSQDLYIFEEAMVLFQLFELRRTEISLLERCISLLKKIVEKKGSEWEIKGLYHLALSLDLAGTLKRESRFIDEAIEILVRLKEKRQFSSFHVMYALAFALSHKGELECEPEFLFQASDLFENLAKRRDDDEKLLGEWGLVLLNLSYLTHDGNHPEKAMKYRYMAETKLMDALKLGYREANYHLATLYAQCGMSERCVIFLERSLDENVCPPIEVLEMDEWLDGVRESPAFQEFLNLLRLEQ